MKLTCEDGDLGGRRTCSRLGVVTSHGSRSSVTAYGGVVSLTRTGHELINALYLHENHVQSSIQAIRTV